MQETQATISAWAKDTFGQSSPTSFLARVLKEFAELSQKTADAGDVWGSIDGIGEEIADVSLMLMDFAERQGFDLSDEIDKKMVINRARKWKITESGHGQHVPESVK